MTRKENAPYAYLGEPLATARLTLTAKERGDWQQRTEQTA